MKTDLPIPILLADYRESDFLINHVFLDITLEDEFVRIKSKLKICRNPNAQHPTAPLILNGEKLKTHWVSVNDNVLDNKKYTISANELIISDVPEKFFFETLVTIEPQKNTELEGLYKSDGIFCSQCEAEGFRRITWYIDRPDILARFKTRITGEKLKYPVMLSNGNCTKTETYKNKTHSVTWEDPHPKPAYLFALVAGDLGCLRDKFTTASGRKVALEIFVDKGRETQADHAMQCLKKAMLWDEEVFNLEYDLDIYMIVAVSAFNMGAMENKGLNLFNDKYVLADPKTATDTDYALIEAIIAHEYFHNWTGNRVTCRDWFQLSLKEGLTVFRDQQFSADMTSASVERIRSVKALRDRQFSEDSSPLSHPIRPESYIEINNFYTATVYEKGAEVIRMLHTLLGQNGFRKGMDLYFERHDGQAVTCEDFISAMEDANNFDLRQFQNWYSQAGTPELSINSHFDAENKSFVLNIQQYTPPTQGQLEKTTLHIPIRFGLLNSNGKQIPLNANHKTELILELKQKEQHFIFTGISAPPIPSLLRNFSAPVRIEWLTKEGRSPENLALLMKHDTDPFNRWEASQVFVKDLILGTACNGASDDTRVEIFANALREILEKSTSDPALLGEILVLPSETELWEGQPVINVDAIHKSREIVREQIAILLKSQLLKVYEALSTDEPYKYNASQVGKRRLKNLALYYLTALDRKDTVEIAKTQFDNSLNMTDCMGALIALNNCRAEERNEALEKFYTKWQGNQLVIDKWFTLHASSFRHGTIRQIEKLMKHDAFSMTSPNRVRALIGTFCNSNQIQFHSRDGAGYTFLAKQVTKLNDTNPQIAARLLTPLSRWRHLDGDRQKLIKSSLENILADKKISRNVFEIANKILGND